MTPAEITARAARQDHADAVAAVDWDEWRACPTCKVAMGRPCVSRSGLVVNGRPDGVVFQLEHPHVARKRRVRRRRR